MKLNIQLFVVWGHSLYVLSLKQFSDCIWKTREKIYLFINKFSFDFMVFLVLNYSTLESDFTQNSHFLLLFMFWIPLEEWLKSLCLPFNTSVFELNVFLLNSFITFSMSFREYFSTNFYDILYYCMTSIEWHIECQLKSGFWVFT